MKDKLNRRAFLNSTSIAGAALAIGLPTIARGASGEAGKPAALGGTKIRTGGFPGWPVFDQTEEQALLEALRSGHWFRGSGKAVTAFEEAYASLTGAKHCLATASGTAALCTALGAL